MYKKITEKEIKAMLKDYKSKKHNEFTEEELVNLEKIMCDGIDVKDEKQRTKGGQRSWQRVGFQHEKKRSRILQA